MTPGSQGGLLAGGLLAFQEYMASQATIPLLQWGHASQGGASKSHTWKPQFSRRKIIPRDENEPYINFKEGYAIRCGDVDFFVSVTASPRERSTAARIKDFCEGAEALLDEKNSWWPESRQSHRLDAQRPRAWVSDQNWDPDDPDKLREYPRTISTVELYQTLRKKRFSENPRKFRLPPPRRVYINYASGASILALIRTARACEAQGLRELLNNYFNPCALPVLSLRESDWWGGCFVFNFNLPYYAITTSNNPDIRTVFQQPLRHQYDLSFLSLPRCKPVDDDGGNSRPPVQAWLRDGMCSIMVTGKNEGYWSAFCLIEEPFAEEEPRLGPDEDQGSEGIAEPITLGLEDCSTISPRAYALQALVQCLQRILEHQKLIQERFEGSINFFLGNHSPVGPKAFPEYVCSPQPLQPTHCLPEGILPAERLDWCNKFRETLNRVVHLNSRLLEKLDHFLAERAIAGLDRIPSGSLFYSLQKDNLATTSLPRLIHCRAELHDVNQVLLRYKKACDDYSLSLTDVQHEVAFMRPWASAVGDTCKRAIERIAGHKLSWWPLLDPEDVLKPGHTRVYSTPSTNCHVYDDIPTPLAESMFPKLAKGRASTPKTRWMASKGEAVFLQGTTLMRLVLKSFQSGSAMGITEPGRPAPQHDSRSDEMRNRGGSAQQPADIHTEGQAISRISVSQNGRPAQIDDQMERQTTNRDERVLFLSADIGLNESISQTVHPGENDRATCQNLRWAYQRLSNKWWRWKQATGIKFYRFDSFLFKAPMNYHFIDVHKDKERYPDVSDAEYGEYRYNPQPWPSGVPYPNRELWYYLMHPDDCGTSNEMNQMLPIRVANGISPRMRGFGIHIEERYSVLAILCPALIMITLTLLATVWFIPRWLQNHPGDLQNATVPVTLACTVIGSFIQLLVSLVLFRWTSP